MHSEREVMPLCMDDNQSITVSTLEDTMAWEAQQHRIPLVLQKCFITTESMMTGSLFSECIRCPDIPNLVNYSE